MITTDELYNLLPAVYRIRDSENGEPLKALLSVFAAQASVVESDIERLYDDWFIETCEEWVVPYIGDLLGVRGLNAVTAATFSQRARVANTIAYRRRKGTATMLEQLARDVTDYPARAVEYFQLLETTQYYNHIRSSNWRTPDLRDTNKLELLGTPFDTIAHTGEVRRIARGRGRYNIPNIGLWLWRLQSYPMARATARAVAAPLGRYTFHPLGQSRPLFNEPQTETEITHLAGEENVPGILRRRPLFDELNARRAAIALGASPQTTYFGDNPVLQVYVDSATPLPPEKIAICNLSDLATGDWRRPAAPLAVAVDPVLGRLSFPTGVKPRLVEVSYSYGFSGDYGGGPYDRSASVSQALVGTVTFQRGVFRDAPSADPQLRKTITQALNDWKTTPAGSVGLICVMDNRTYEEVLTIEIKPGSQLFLIAADWPEVPDPNNPIAKIRQVGDYAADDLRPCVIGDVKVTRGAGAGTAGSLTIDGLLIQGGLSVAANSLSALRLAHSTLVPGSGKLSVAASEADLVLDHAICGDIALDPAVRSLSLADSIAAAVQAAGVDCAIERSTVFGKTTARTLEAGNSVFLAPVSVERRQIGCMRFCYVPDLPVTPKPRRYRCQPDLALEGVTDPAGQDRVRTRLRPMFTSTDYGHPAFAQLALACAEEIRTGAEDGSEMGVFSALKQPQREANLRASLDEFLRFGMEAGIFFVT